MNRFADHCFQSWQRKHGMKPPWGAKEYAQLSQVMKRFKGDFDAACASWEKFLANSDPFFEGHEPGMFLNRISRFVARPERVRVGSKWDQAVAARVKIMMDVEADPRFKTTKEIRDEYARRAREL